MVATLIESLRFSTTGVRNRIEELYQKNERGGQELDIMELLLVESY